jgi:hypothetical protein
MECGLPTAFIQQEVVVWFRHVQLDVWAALETAPEAWFSGRDRIPQWSYYLYIQSAYHRVKYIERALTTSLKS